MSSTGLHRELCERAARWLKNSQRCGVVLCEFFSWYGEQPDAIGWKGGGEESTLVECKISVSDFHADRQKPFRKNPELGIGKKRYFLTPRGLLDAARLENDCPGWGLLEVHGMVIKKVKESAVFRPNLQQELSLFYSLHRRHDFNDDVKGEFSSSGKG